MEIEKRLYFGVNGNLKVYHLIAIESAMQLNPSVVFDPVL
jgi:hypothetical protein